MRYDRDGRPIVRKVHNKTSFADMFITIRFLGYEIQYGRKLETICLRRDNSKDALHYDVEDHYLTLEDLPEWLNQKMADEGYIVIEVEE